ncbi:MAG: hypothetical protein SPE14_07165 [Anaerovibrio sp.]|nr:hypothetical protein [Anaerovibrio sp.]
MESLETQLERVQMAIAAIESGAQSYQIANRKVTKGDLATLYAREKSLKAEIARASGGDLYFAELGRL